MSAQYLVTVVVPTHNRSKYAIPCVKSLLEIRSDDLQVVVHDTSNDACELAEWAAAQNDPRLVYVHWKHRLSMTENHERAIALATGEYVCLIGDDDSVTDRIMEFAQYAKDNAIAMLTPKVRATYYWPDFRTKFYGDAHAGKIYLEQFDATVTDWDVSERLDNALNQACQGTDAMPKLYHGLVRNELLSRLREKNGKVFFGTSPDMSAAVALSLLSGRYSLIDFPFTLPGGAGGSNSGRSAVGKHKGNLKDDPHLAPFKNLVWPDVIPRFFSVETVWAHAAWETLENAGGGQRRLNLARLYALCFFHHRDYARATWDAWRAASSMNIEGVGVFATLGALVDVAGRYVFGRIKRVMKPGANYGREIVATVDDVQLAKQELDRCLTAKVGPGTVTIKRA
jgi:hypothetical protein